MSPDDKTAAKARRARLADKNRNAAGKRPNEKSRHPAAGLMADALPNNAAIVAATIANQLHQEGRWPPNDVTKVMSTDYHYNQITLINFLKAVQWQLLHGTPSLQFTFSGDFVLQALPFSVGALMVAVASKTQ